MGPFEREGQVKPDPEIPLNESNVAAPELSPEQVSSDVITSVMSISEVILNLSNRGCEDITDQLDETSCSKHPIFKGGFGDIYKAKLKSGTEVAIKTMRLFVNSNSQDQKFLKSTQIAEGLSYLHQEGIVHGDLKALNVLVTTEGVPLIVDFGNATLRECTLQFTATSTKNAISLRWAAPEVLEGKATYTVPADVYALGMTILETITGCTPWYGLTEPAVMYAVASKRCPERPAEHIPEDSWHGNILWSLLNSCWAYEPGDRPKASGVKDIMQGVAREGLKRLPVAPVPTPVATQHLAANTVLLTEPPTATRAQPPESGSHLMSRPQPPDKTPSDVRTGMNKNGRQSTEDAAGSTHMNEELDKSSTSPVAQSERPAGRHNLALGANPTGNEALSSMAAVSPMGLEGTFAPRVAPGPVTPQLQSMANSPPPPPPPKTQGVASNLQASSLPSPLPRARSEALADTDDGVNVATPLTPPSSTLPPPQLRDTPQDQARPPGTAPTRPPQPTTTISAPQLTPFGMKTAVITVPKSNIRVNERGKEVLSFTIEVELDPKGWRVEKLYSDLLALDVKVRKLLERSAQKQIAPLPDAKLLKDIAPFKLDQRKAMLQEYLQAVLGALWSENAAEVALFFTSDVISPDLAPTSRPRHKEGYLTERGEKFGGWKTRYFVLQSPVLEYYESRGGAHLGSIPIVGSKIGRQQRQSDPDDENADRHAFLIV
ncbi:hypothetical protein FRC06_003217, partial [Ceratobasidium sp. 370]